MVPVSHRGIVTSAQDYARSVEKLTVRPLRRRLQSRGLRLNGKQRLPVKLPRRNWRPDESSADRTSGTSFERSVRSAGTIDLDRDAFSGKATCILNPAKTGFAAIRWKLWHVSDADIFGCSWMRWVGPHWIRSRHRPISSTADPAPNPSDFTCQPSPAAASLIP